MPLSAETQYYVDNNYFTQEQAENLTEYAINALNNINIRTMLIREIITPAHIVAITNRWAVHAFSNDDICDMMDAGIITPEYIAAISSPFVEVVLEIPNIAPLVAQRIITPDHIAAITNNWAVNAFLDSNISTLIAAGRLTPYHISQLTHVAVFALRSPNVRALVMENILTMEQAITLTDAEINALGDAETIQRLRNGDIPIEYIVNRPAHNPAPLPHINDDQSTHHTSIHASASESAMRLLNRYGALIKDKESLVKIIEEIKNYVEGLPDENPKNKAAKRCILRITNTEHTYTDTKSKISIIELLALVFSAIKDDSQRIGGLEDALAQFIEGLYETQRGYNIKLCDKENKFVDDGGEDNFVCFAGAFNKIIDRAQSIHPDCRLIFITRETVLLKLLVVVREETKLFLLNLAKSNPIKASHVLALIKTDGVKVIWNDVKIAVANRMFEEFGSLYYHATDPAFTTLIEGGKEAELEEEELNFFQEQMGDCQYYSMFSPQEEQKSAEQEEEQKISHSHKF